MRVTAVLMMVIATLAAPAHSADSGSETLIPVDATIVDPPAGSIIGGGLIELAVRPASPAVGVRGWTLCAQASELANTSCIVCEAVSNTSSPEHPPCVIEVGTAHVGVIEPRVWAADATETTVDQLRGLVLGPSSAKTRLGVLMSTPIEVFRLGVSELWKRPFETSKSWWGRSTAPAMSSARSAALESELLDEPAASQPLPAPPAPPLSLRRHATFLGAALPEASPSAAAPAAARRVLVAVVAGARGASVVDATLSSLQASLGPSRGLDVLLMTYDGTDWDEVAREGAAARAAQGGAAAASGQSWAAEATVVRRRGHMKWWFVKRFVSPAVAASGEYGWVLVLDEDALLAPSFDGPGFLATLEAHGAKMGQPMHADASETSFGFLQETGALRLAAGEGREWEGGNTLDGLAVRPEAAGDARPGVAEVLWTTMVECGPVAAFRADVWPCVWELLQPDLVSGFGYDLVWASRCARDEEGIAKQAGPGLRAAVTLQHRLRHADLGTASSLHAGFFRRAVGEGLVLFERLRAEAVEAAGRAEALEGVVAARGEDDGPAGASELIRKALRVDQARGVMPMEPRVIGVGRRLHL